MLNLTPHAAWIRQSIAQGRSGFNKKTSRDKGRKALRFRGTTFIPPAVQTLAALAGS
jgi:hypothetical protein